MHERLESAEVVVHEVHYAKYGNARLLDLAEETRAVLSIASRRLEFVGADVDRSASRPREPGKVDRGRTDGRTAIDRR